MRWGGFRKAGACECVCVLGRASGSGLDGSRENLGGFWSLFNGSLTPAFGQQGRALSGPVYKGCALSGPISMAMS